MNLTVPGATLPLSCMFLSTGAKTVRGLLQPLFGEPGLNQQNQSFSKVKLNLSTLQTSFTGEFKAKPCGSKKKKKKKKEMSCYAKSLHAMFSTALNGAITLN